MSDIWSGIGGDIASSDGEWLYRLGEEVRGPIPFDAVVGKILRGELPPTTMVAKEGGEFHPMARVAAFAPYVKTAAEQAAARARKRNLMIGLVVVLVLAVGGGVGGFFFFLQVKAKKEQHEAERRAQEALIEQKRLELEKAPKMQLVALVSLGTEDEVKIKNQPSGSSRKGKTERPGAKDTGKAGPTNEVSVSSCMLSQQDIFGTLKKHLAKINVCVEDEKTRDAANLPSQLELEFVVKPNGKVVEFTINDRHYRTGPMKNCMVKAFNTISFPESTGTTCPVTIPIKIGG